MILNLNFNENYCDYALISITSYIDLNPHVFSKILVLTDSPDVIVKLEVFRKSSAIKIEVHNVSGLLSDHPKIGRFEKIVYARFLVPNFVKDERVLYVDVDTICTDFIGELSEITLNSSLAGVVDEFHTKRFKPKFDYLNAGVLLFDCNSYIEKTFKKSLNLCLKNNYKYADQDGLNQVLKGNFDILQPTYNYTSNFECKDKLVKIIHFAHSKPWCYPCWNDYKDMFLNSSMTSIKIKRHFAGWKSIIKYLLKIFAISP